MKIQLKRIQNYNNKENIQHFIQNKNCFNKRNQVRIKKKEKKRGDMKMMMIKKNKK